MRKIYNILIIFIEKIYKIKLKNYKKFIILKYNNEYYSIRNENNYFFY